VEGGLMEFFISLFLSEADRKPNDESSYHSGGRSLLLFVKGSERILMSRKN
jgi:hypothetical protein